MNVRESRNVGAVSAKVWHKVSKRRPWILRSTSSWAPHPCRVKESLCASATLTSLTLQTVCSTKSIEPSKLNEQLQLVEIFWIQPGHWEQCKDWYTCQLKAPNVFFSKETHHLLHTLFIKRGPRNSSNASLIMSILDNIRTSDIPKIWRFCGLVYWTYPDLPVWWSTSITSGYKWVGGCLKLSPELQTVRQIDRQVVRWSWSFGYSNILKTCHEDGGLATTHTLILQKTLFSW